MVATATPPLATAGCASRDAIEPQGFGVDELSGPAQAPAIEQEAVVHRLPHAGASEHNRLRQYQPCVLCQIDIDRALEPRPIEQDRLLRQPGERAASGDV